MNILFAFIGFCVLGVLIIMCAIWSDRLADRIRLRRLLNKDRLWIDPDASISARAVDQQTADQPVSRPIPPPIDCRRSIANTGQPTPQQPTGRPMRPIGTRAVMILPSLIRHRCVTRIH